jgi:D-sedoheptulose 7-phosphate isomerase
VSYAQDYLSEVGRILQQIDAPLVEQAVTLLADTRTRGGRLFVLGVGGSAANASHAVNDFRKIAGIEAYAPTDNVAELTARANDEGWASVFEGWLRGSRITADDLILVLSVGGGDEERDVSPNIVRALRYARQRGSRVLGIVGRREGFTARVADVCILVPEVNPEHLTPHTEAFQSVLLHLFVSHPQLQQVPTKWESVR